MLNPKVTTCPKCGKIKSNTKPCSYCGYHFSTTKPKMQFNPTDILFIQDEKTKKIYQDYVISTELLPAGGQDVTCRDFTFFVENNIIHTIKKNNKSKEFCILLEHYRKVDTQTYKLLK